MNWYDLIAPLYDIGATGSGGPRRHAVDRLQLQPGDVVLDVACGTGLNFPLVRDKIGPDGLLVGLDFSAGMLAKARRKMERDGWQNVRLVQADARTVSAELLSQHGGVPGVDKVLCTLGLSVVPDWEEVFRRSWALLRPGGRYVIMDWYVERRNPFSWFLNRISQGDVSRMSWAPLSQGADDYSQQTFVFGNVFVAGGTKPQVRFDGIRSVQGVEARHRHQLQDLWSRAGRRRSRGLGHSRAARTTDRRRSPRQGLRGHRLERRSTCGSVCL